MKTQNGFCGKSITDIARQNATRKKKKKSINENCDKITTMYNVYRMRLYSLSLIYRLLPPRLGVLAIICFVLSISLSFIFCTLGRHFANAIILMIHILTQVMAITQLALYIDRFMTAVAAALSSIMRRYMRWIARHCFSELLSLLNHFNGFIL